MYSEANISGDYCPTTIEKVVCYSQFPRERFTDCGFWGGGEGGVGAERMQGVQALD